MFGELLSREEAEMLVNEVYPEVDVPTASAELCVNEDTILDTEA